MSYDADVQARTAALFLALLALPAPILRAGLRASASATQDYEQLWQAGQRAQAIEAQARALAARPDDRALRRSLAEREFAVHWYQQALDHAAPLGEDMRALRAKALFFLHRFEEAYLLLDAADFEQLEMRQASAERLGRQEDADRELEAMALLVGAEHPSVASLRGLAALRAGQAERAIACFQTALAKDATRGEALYGLGRAQLELGQREAGLATLERHRELVKKLDQWDFARRGVDLAPVHAPNLARLAEAEAELGRDDAARERFEQATRLAADDQITPVALRYARFLSEREGGLDRAVQVLEEAATRRPDAHLFVRSGDLLLSHGRGIEAVQRFYRARELRPDDEQIKQRIAAARASYVKPNDGPPPR